LLASGLNQSRFREIKESLAELEEPVSAWGGEVVGNVASDPPQFQSRHIIGSAKCKRSKRWLAESSATVVIVDHSLSGVQGRNLQNELGARVMDRNQVILDIFAQRAKTYEGQLQVELAQMLDQLPRMVGAWLDLCLVRVVVSEPEALVNSVGIRSPPYSRAHEGYFLSNSKASPTTDVNTGHFVKNSESRRFALIGYTNSGRAFAQSTDEVRTLCKRPSVATLDPTTRKSAFAPGPAVLTDTDGFMRKLPGSFDRGLQSDS